MDPALAKEALHRGCEILERLKLYWWVSAGTALGAYRDGFSDAFLNHDSDIDVKVLGNERADETRDAFYAAGFTPYAYGRNRMGPAQLAPKYKGIIFDVWFMTEVGDDIIAETSVGTMWQPTRLTTNLGTLTIDGHVYPAPNPIEEYLLHKYGDDWRVPRKVKRPWQEGSTCVRATPIANPLG